jgi:hypothetical protein
MAVMFPTQIGADTETAAEKSSDLSAMTVEFLLVQIRGLRRRAGRKSAGIYWQQRSCASLQLMSNRATTGPRI